FGRPVHLTAPLIEPDLVLHPDILAGPQPVALDQPEIQLALQPAPEAAAQPGKLGQRRRSARLQVGEERQEGVSDMADAGHGRSCSRAVMDEVWRVTA